MTEPMSKLLKAKERTRMFNDFACVDKPPYFCIIFKSYYLEIEVLID